MPRLESAIKEALRLHPPLILLLRVAKEDLECEGFAIRAGQMVGASPSVSNRIPEDFPEPEAFRPARYLEPREEDRLNPWTWIPFGAGRHRCVGQAFAMMQLKAIFSVLLLDWEFELAQPPDTYRNDHSKMVVQLQQPCVVRYRRRTVARSGGSGRRRRCGLMRVVVDADLCQGHGVCESEAPDVFAVGQDHQVERARPVPAGRPPRRRRGRRPLLPHPRPVHRGRLSVLRRTPSRTTRTTEPPEAGPPNHRQGVAPCRRTPAVSSKRRCSAGWTSTGSARRSSNWLPLADMFTEDATYGWNVGPNDEFMAVGRDQIREYAVGLEMEGLGGWTYPYMRILIDEVQGEILGLWKQVADATRPDGSHYEIAGLGGSWFRYGGEPPVELAARLLRRRQRHGHLHRDDPGRRPQSRA